MKKLLVAVVAIVALVGVPMVSMADVTSNSQSQTQSNAGALIDQSGQNNSIRNDSQRYLPNAGITPIPGTNGFFTSPTPDSSFRGMKEFLRFAGPIFSEGALEEMAKGADVDVLFQMYNGQNRVKRAKAVTVNEEETSKWIKIILDHNGDLEKEGDVRFSAVVQGEADDGDTNSIQVLAKMALKALRNGNNLLVLTNQGAHRIVEASGWGIGLYTVGSDVSSGGSTAGVAGGGLGFAKNEAGPEDRPWLHGYAGVRSNPVIPDLPNAGKENK